MQLGYSHRKFELQQSRTAGEKIKNAKVYDAAHMQTDAPAAGMEQEAGARDSLQVVDSSVSNPFI